MLENGTIINGTKCDSPVDNIETRGALGITFAVLFATFIMWGLVNLRKHGQSHLPVEKQFRLVSRRWPYYWLIFTAAVGCISGFMAIDVDRDRIPGTAIILQSVFYYVSLPMILAAVWEMTRHWGSFEERKVLDEDPFALQAEDRRSKFEFYLPLIFYLFGFLTFFMSVLRTWTPITKQHFPTAHLTATDPRFRASSIFSVLALLTILFSSIITTHYYRVSMPLKVPLSLIFLSIRIVYGLICTFGLWEINAMNIDANSGFVYGLGYAPMVLVLLIMCIGGWREENEDLIIIRKRRERDFRDEVELKEKRREEKEKEKQRKMEGGGQEEEKKKIFDKVVV